ncbi:MAG: hypothetical protein ACE5G0_09410 [Rhodothermales bacterium]
MNMTPQTLRRWHLLGSPPPSSLEDARLQLHWASQIVASVGFSYIEPVPDWSHTSLEWIDDQGLFASQSTSNTRSFRAALRPADLRLFLLNPDGHILSQFSLDSHTLDDGYAWLSKAIAAHTGIERELERPEHEPPSHLTASGHPFFRVPPDAFLEISRWFADADRVLQALRASTPNASPVRIWPHHFDIATLLEFDRGTDVEEARSIGVGLAPSDTYYDEFYWYILPWPSPDTSTLPPLEDGGFWHTERWVGAVLPASELLASRTAETQAQRVRRFIRSGIETSRRLLALSD